MRIFTLIARIVLGLIFFVFGLNHLVHFLHEPPMPASDAATYGQLLITHHVMTFVGFLMVLAGLLLLAGRYVPVALVILGPILVNILMFHILFGHPGLPLAAVCTVLEVSLIVAYWRNFRGVFEARRLAS